MPTLPRDYAIRTDVGPPQYIGSAIREIIRLTLEEGLSWQIAADRVGVKRTRVAKALMKPHVRAYRLEKRRQLIEELSGRVPLRLSQLMDGENEAASVRACLAMEELRNEVMAESGTRRIGGRGGIVIVIGDDRAKALPQAAPQLELQVEGKDRIGARD
jgi:hypothetical protein